jgi:Tfp pilus assembly protein PilV
LASPYKQPIFIFPFHGYEKQVRAALFHNQKSKSFEGFTIMEVALAATVLALTLVGMIQVIDSGSEMLDLSRKQTIAGQILHSEIDQLRLQSWATVTAYTPGPTQFQYTSPLSPAYDPVLAAMAQQLGGTFPYTVTRTVTCVQPAANPYPYALPPLLLQVTFTVAWTGVTGHSYTRTSTTYVGQNGLSAAYQRS